MSDDGRSQTDDLREEAARLGREQFLPLVEKAEHGVSRELVESMASAGLFEQVFDDDAVSASALCAIREGLARVCTTAETAFALQGLGGTPILRFGTDEIVAKWLPRLRAGTAVAAFALTEPGAGSDAAALELHAAADEGGGYTLTGEKLWISNAPDADVYTVFARTGPPGRSARGVTAFAIPGDAAGLSGERLAMLSPHPLGRLRFDGVRVGPEQVLGEVGHGFLVAMRTLDVFRPSVGACADGIAQAALDRAVSHAALRPAFGATLRDFQAVSHPLADVATSVHAARHLVRHAAWSHDSASSDVTAAAAMAKLFATETAQRAVDVAIQVCGAAALEQGHLLEHLYRDVRALRIYEGASEIQREIISRTLFATDGAR